MLEITTVIAIKRRMQTFRANPHFLNKTHLINHTISSNRNKYANNIRFEHQTSET